MYPIPLTKYLVDEAGFCHEELFNKFESSTAERTIMSSIGYVIGLCPLNYKEMLTHLFENYFNEFST